MVYPIPTHFPLPNPLPHSPILLPSLARYHVDCFGIIPRASFVWGRGTEGLRGDRSTDCEGVGQGNIWTAEES